MSLVLTAEQARASDRWIIEECGLPGLLLMENAGTAAVAVLEAAWAARGGQLEGAQVAVICGAGQNGGDGLVMARHLAQRHARVTVLMAFPMDKVRGDAASNFRFLCALGQVPVHDCSALTTEQAWLEKLLSADVVVDALFGTGLHSEVSGVPAAAIAAMNRVSALRVAVDVPSGLDADTGLVCGCVVNADVTVTMAALKLGLVLDARAPVGTLHVAGLGAPVHAPLEGGPYGHWVDEVLVKRLLPKHGQSAHKGSRGHLLLIAGSQGKTGAAALSGTAAMRAGAGLVTLATTKAGQVALDAKLWEVMSFAFTASEDAEPNSYARLIDLAKGMKAVALGPGIPTGAAMKDLVVRLARESALPMVIDADGLNHLGVHSDVLRNAAGPRVLTPHPGEMARLLACDIAEVQADRAASARRLAERTRSTVVLKGARTVIAEPDGTLYINPAASSSLATAGSGDVLTGTIGALLAQGLGATDAAICGVYVHGQAAQDACAKLELDNLVAGDLSAAIARELHRLS